MACNLNFDGKKFENEKELDQYISDNILNKKFSDLTQDQISDVIDRIQDKVLFFDENAYEQAEAYAKEKGLRVVRLEVKDSSKEDQEGQEDRASHKYFYVDGEFLREAKSVTRKIDQDFPYEGGTAQPIGEFSKLVGIRHHELAKEVIDKLNAGQKVDLNTYDIAHEREWVDTIIGYYNEWTKDGSIVKSEFRAINTYKGREIAGTIDIAVIGKDGSIRIFDYKFSRHPFTEKMKLSERQEGARAKLRSNQVQLRMYARLLELGDETTKTPGMQVTDASIIPVHIKSSEIEGADSNASLEEKFKVDEIITKDPISYDDKSIFEQLIGVGITAATNAITSKADKEKKFMGIKDGSSVDFTGVEHITGSPDTVSVDDNQELFIARRAAEEPLRTKDGKKIFVYRDEKNTLTYYENDVAATDSSERGNIARKKEIREKLVPKMNRLRTDAAQEFITYFTTGKTELFASEDESSSDSKRNIADSILKWYDPVSDHMELLSGRPGFENVGNDVVIVWRNWDPETESFTKVDLLSIDTSYDAPLYEKKGRKSFLGEHLSDVDVKVLKNGLGLNSLMPFDRTVKNSKLLKLGLIAMELKRTNPDIKVDNLTAAGIVVVKKGSNQNTSRATMNEVLKQIKLMANAEFRKSDKSVKGLIGDELFDLITEHPYLYNAKNYGGGEVKAFFEYLYHQLSSPDPNLEKDYEKLNNLFSGLGLTIPLEGGSIEPMRMQLDIIMADRDQKYELLRLLGKRQRRIRGSLRDSENDSERVTLSLEYQFLNSAIREIWAITDDFHKITDMSLFDMFTTSAGFTGIAMIDDFTKVVKRKMNILSRHYIVGLVEDGKMKQGYMRRKEKMFNEFLGQRNQIEEVLLGNSSKEFMRLIEKKWFVVSDVNSKTRGAKELEKYGAKWFDTNPDTGISGYHVQRRTGRFWQKGSNEYKNLSSKDKNFIEEFNKVVKEGFLRNMGPKKAAAIEKMWGEGWIPIVRSTTANLIYKVFADDTDGPPTAEKMRAAVRRYIDRYRNMQDFFDVNDDDMEKLLDVFDTQLNQAGLQEDFLKNQFEYGNSGRLHSLGLKKNDSGDVVAELHYRDADGTTHPYTDRMETNLEIVLDLFEINSLRKYHLEPLIPLYRAVRAGINMASHQYFKDFDNAHKYLKVYVDNAFFNKRQIAQGKLGRKFEAMMTAVIGATSSAALGYNYLNWIKNHEASWVHTAGNTLAKMFAGTAHPGKYVDAVQEVYRRVMYNTGKEKWNSKVHTVMSSMALGDFDPERLAYDKRYKVSGKNMLQSHIAHWGNLYGDYVIRSIMVASHMKVDGTWEAVTEQKDGTWKYNEDLDPRFKGDKGKALKKWVKELMAEEGTLDENGRMVVPYTTDEIMTMKKEADLTFENQTSYDQALVKQWSIGMLFAQMHSWMISKKERMALHPLETSHMGRHVVNESVDENGNKVLTPSWQNDQREGWFYTMMNLTGYLQARLSNDSQYSFAEYWKNLGEVQKENIGRVTNDILVAGMLTIAVSMALAALAGDDELETEPDNWFSDVADSKRRLRTLWYITAGAIDESFFLAHLGAMSDLFVNPFPSGVMALKLAKALTSADPNKAWRETFRYFGPLKLIPMTERVAEDFTYLMDR